jgi:protein TonB
MQNDVLNSEKWLSLVFEGRNKNYGAYVQREESSNRHLQAMFIITIVALGLIFLPKMIKSVIPAMDRTVPETGIVKPTIFAPQDPVENPVKPVAPPVLYIETKKFVPPVIAPDEDVVEKDLMETQRALTETTVAISSETYVGDPGGTVDIATVKEHGEVIGEPVQQKIFITAEVMPLFPGGDVALMKWLRDNLTYPAIAQEKNIQGRVTLRFVVSPDGSIDQVEIVKGLDPSCDKEALRVVKKMPKWIPGKQNGNAVSVYYSLPIVFKLNNQ